MTGVGQHSVPATIVLVHGAFSDASVWHEVILRLQGVGWEVLAPATPLFGLAHDAAYLTSVVREIEGPVVLVGLGFGGAVISAAAASLPAVRALVFVAGFALDIGESCVDVFAGRGDAGNLDSAVPHVVERGEGGPLVEISVRPDRFAEVITRDMPPSQATAAAVAQRPIVNTALEEPAVVAAWRDLPCWYVMATHDGVINVETQHELAARCRAQTVELDAAHFVPRSRPDELAAVIASAAA